MLYTADRINKIVREGRFNDLVENCEYKHILQYENLTRMINESHKLSLNTYLTDAVLITGPSSSGKTTFSRRLARELKERGYNPILISFDNYYHDHETIWEMQGLPYGTPAEEMDLETPDAFDIAYFRQQMNEFLSGKTVTLPEYDFLTKKRTDGVTITPTFNDIIIVEGIHGLNPLLTEGVAFHRVFRVYVCPFDVYTAGNTDGSVIIPQHIRLMRRTMRDYAERGAHISRTFGMWPKVREGEELYIKPMKKYADFFFNSAFEYEICLLKYRFTRLLDMLDDGMRSMIDELIPFDVLDAFTEVHEAVIPENSLFKEFYK